MSNTYQLRKEYFNNYYNEKRNNDPEFKEKEKQRIREYLTNRYKNDEEYREKIKAQKRELYYKNKELLQEAKKLLAQQSQNV